MSRTRFRPISAGPDPITTRPHADRQVSRPTRTRRPTIGLVEGDRSGRSPRARRPSPTARTRDDVADRSANSLEAAGPGVAARLGPPARPDRRARGLGGRASLTSGARWPGRRSRSRGARSTTWSTAPRARAVLQGDARPGSSAPARRSGSAATRAGASPSRSWPWSSRPALKLVGFTVGNDVSARDIEGENPLYLPQAKVYDACCALGPSSRWPPRCRPPASIEIRLEIDRGGSTVVRGPDVGRAGWRAGSRS